MVVEDPAASSEAHAKTGAAFVQNNELARQRTASRDRAMSTREALLAVGGMERTVQMGKVVPKCGGHAAATGDVARTGLCGFVSAGGLERERRRLEEVRHAPVVEDGQAADRDEHCVRRVRTMAP